MLQESQNILCRSRNDPLPPGPPKQQSSNVRVTIHTNTKGNGYPGSFGNVHGF